MPLSLYVFSRLIRQFQNSDISLTNQVQNLQAERPSARRTQTPPADASGLNSGRPQVPRPHGPFSIVALFVELPRAPHPSPAFLDGSAVRCGHRGGRGASHCCELWGQDSAGDRRSPPLSSPAAQAPASPPASCHASVTVPSPRAQRRISRRTRRAASCCESRDGASRRSARLRRSRHRGQRAQLMPRARDARSQQRLPGWPSRSLGTLHRPARSRLTPRASHKHLLCEDPAGGRAQDQQLPSGTSSRAAGQL